MGRERYFFKGVEIFLFLRYTEAMNEIQEKLKRAVVIVGPTGSGKSALAIRKAEEIGGVIINADSMQIYAELNVVTARPSFADMQKIPHRLYGVLSGREVCSAARWLEMAAKEIKTVWAEGKTPIIAGGTGLYIKVLLEGLSPIPDIPSEIRAKARSDAEEMGNEKLREKLALYDSETAEKFTDKHRIIRAWEVLLATGKPHSYWRAKEGLKLVEAEWEKIKLEPERNDLYARCDARFLKMLEDGAVEEVNALLALNLSPDLPITKALGVPEISAFIKGESDRETMIAKAQQSTRNYAKRQLTWFRHQF